MGLSRIGGADNVTVFTHVALGRAPWNLKLGNTVAKPNVKPRETDLYPPVKAYLEAQGYEVKAEIGAVDVVAVRGDEAPVLVELKLGFTLTLLHQGVARQAISDDVYLAVPRGKGKPFLTALKGHLSLCRRLGLGLITVRLKDEFVEVHLDPAPFTPRKSKTRQTRLLREFARRVGDPNAGGQTRVGLVTAYRQDATKIAAFLAKNGPSKGAVVAKATGVEVATRMMADDHYGWFERVGLGVYALTPKGEQAHA
ncbi:MULTISPECIES: DUF2161 domain-containing phosphodiesterase [Falsihalocynthiibacter]|uniref:DUF2161 domain-containing phosphodiesterase n=1 Tax=Falsihalocynthiibacter TaxID=2854182 RepID=UPI0030019A82